MNRDNHRKLQVLTALDAEPLDRIRLVKTLFLVWHRAGEPDSGPFSFKPYLYRPCSFELYEALSSMQEEKLLAQAPHPNYRWSRYYITDRGRQVLENFPQPSADEAPNLRETAQWAAVQSFTSLLQKVYSEAPEFAGRSVVRTQAQPL